MAKNKKKEKKRSSQRSDQREQQRSDSQEQRRLDLQVALLISLKIEQKVIGKILGVSEAKVFRAKVRAEKQRGWLDPTPRFLANGIDEGELAEVENLLRVKLAGRRKAIDGLVPERLGVRTFLDSIADSESRPQVVNIAIFNSGSTSTDAKAYHHRLETFGKAAAVYFEGCLARASIMGVTWGSTIRHVVDGLGRTTKLRTASSGPTFIPVSGEPLVCPVSKLSASTIAADLQHLVNGSTGEAIALGPVPARIPKDLAIDEVRSLIKLAQGYRRVFVGIGNDKPLVDRMDSLLTSVGTVAPEKIDPWLDDTIAAEGIKREELAKLTIGDIGGVLLANASSDEVVRDINQRWTGITETHIEECSRRANKARLDAARDEDAQNMGPPGVVLVAIGSAKARVIVECVRRGLVNELVIDHDLASALAKMGAKSRSGIESAERLR